MGSSPISGFDPRLRAGGDAGYAPRSHYGRCFDPRLRAGGDVAAMIGQRVGVVSIHASAQEATFTKWAVGVRAYVSIHASAQEATGAVNVLRDRRRSEEHTSELQSLMRISYAVLCLQTQTK